MLAILIKLPGSARMVIIALSIPEIQASDYMLFLIATLSAYLLIYLH
jgi:hypothetical protein